jgi:pimeloyl-ACP methyl ester carboxylesterase
MAEQTIAEPIAIKRIGSFHVEGREAIASGLPVQEVVYTRGSPPRPLDPNGEYEVEQMYVQYVQLEKAKAKYPLLMWHGGGMSGVTWEDTPDGRPGWQSIFLRAGHDVYVSDAVERGRASWCCIPGVYEGNAVARPKQESWEGFRFGPIGSWDPDPAKRKSYDGQRFPIAALDAFQRQTVPRWTTSDIPTQRAYDRLIQKVGPAVVMVHSQGGNFGFTAALNAPDKVRAYIGIEPSGTPPPGTDLTGLRDIPHLVVWGDYIDLVPQWTESRARIEAYGAAIRDAGGSFDIIDLPALGIKGNSHFPMMDNNSDAVAALVQDWMESRNQME